MEPTELFRLENLTKTYGRVTALRNLSVSVPKGAIGLLGPNGAGKTTLIRALLGLITLDSGQGQVLGRDIRTQPLQIRDIIGFVPEDECLFPNVAGIEFVAYAGELCGMGRKDAMQRAHEVLNYVGLGEARYRRAESYSTGMKQRLKLAAGIVHDPQLLILDEPTNGMDPAGRQELLDLARDLSSDKGMSLIFSSHILPDIEAVCDYVMVLGRGRLLTAGHMNELEEAHERMYQVRVKLGQDSYAGRLVEAGCGVQPREDGLVVELRDGQQPELLWQAAADSGHQIRHLRPLRSTLEEVFLKAIGETN